MDEKLELTHGPIPSALFELGLRWFQDAPDTERLFAVGWGGAALPAGGAPAGRDRNEARVSAPRRGDRRVPLTRILSRLLLGHRRPGRAGFRIYGVAGHLDAQQPELSLRVGVYGHFSPVEWSQVFDRPGPRRPAHGRTRHTKQMTRR